MDITELTVHELQEKIKSKELTITEITKAYVDRIKEKEPEVQAFITELTEEGMKKAKVLSGGEKVRCMLARAMLKAGNVLILDEPTNHLDLESITALNKGMINYRSPMLFTSQDHEILQTVANRIIVLDGTKVYDRETTYDDYLGIK